MKQKTGKNEKDSQMSASRKFERYKDEEHQEIKKPVVTQDEVLTRLLDIWKAFEFSESKVATSEDLEWYYDKSLGLLKDVYWSARDIEKFSLVFQEEGYWPSKAGFFLSMLINRSVDTEFIVHTDHLLYPPDNLGLYNRRNITVNGPVGNSLGLHMKGGMITVMGDVGDMTGGRMKAGSILIKGNAGSATGVAMLGGTITIEGDASTHAGIKMENGLVLIQGNAGKDVGWFMEGGIVCVNGSIESIAPNIKGGEIRNRETVVYE